MRDNTPAPPTGIERVVASIGSTRSLVVHTVVFAVCFLAAAIGIIAWELMLLVLTTLVSLEAIYLSLLIQITVNRHTQSLKEVEEDIDEIQEDVEGLGEDLEEIQEDIEEISEDIDEISEDIDEIQEDVEELNEEEGAIPKPASAKPKAKAKKPSKDETLDQLAGDIKRMLATLEELKGSK